MSLANSYPVRCLILACGNTLRSDDGVGPWLASWAAERFGTNRAVRVISRQQWTPDFAEDLAGVESVLFIDCAVDIEPGTIRVAPVQPLPAAPGMATHHTDAAELLALSQELFGSRPRDALLLTVGAASTDIGETFSKTVTNALPGACQTLETTVLQLLASSSG